ncbi:MAG: nitroreductase family protein [Bacteroidales bacterium]|nr:nitroreductase family protein [Bacteroidales bacterium]
MTILKRIFIIFLNSCYDTYAYLVHSGVISRSSEQKIEGKLIFYYHSIEKGLINDPIRYKFGTQKIRQLVNYLNLWTRRGYNTSNSQFVSACSVLCSYFELHDANTIDISDIISEEEYRKIKLFADGKSGGVIESDPSRFFSNTSAGFKEFSGSRHSVRHFNGEEIPVNLIIDVINIARNAPSVCNRQSARVILVNNKKLLQEVLRIQGGLNASADTVSQLFVVTSVRGLFVSEGERNQMYTDGGIFLLNLLYSLHYHNIAACPLHAAFDSGKEIRIKRMLQISPEEKIIAFVAFGFPSDNFKVPFSRRKEISEILRIIK